MVQKNRLMNIVTAIGFATVVQTASAEGVLVHSEPVRAARVTAALKVNPSRGVAAVHVTSDRDRFGEEYNLYPAHVIKHVKGLTYNAQTREIRYGKTVCGTVQDQSVLGVKKHRIIETGACKLTKVESKKLVDNGFDDPSQHPVTDIHLHVVDG